MPSPFPEMDPYLEHPELWPGVHNRLIIAIADSLGPKLYPHYWVAVEERMYIAAPDETIFLGRPDLAVLPPHLREAFPATEYAAAPQPNVTVVELPMPDEVTETYLQVRHGPDQKVVTVIEGLSPANKHPGRGREVYEVYDKGGFDLAINYQDDPTPPLEGDDVAWANQLLRERAVR